MAIHHLTPAEHLDLEQTNREASPRCGAPHHTSGSELPCIRAAGHEQTAEVMRESHAAIIGGDWVTWLDVPLANTDPGTAP